eukprot:UN01904
MNMLRLQSVRINNTATIKIQTVRYLCTQLTKNVYYDIRNSTRSWSRRPKTHPAVIELTKNIKSYESNKDWKRATDILRNIQERGLQPSIVTYNATLKICRMAKNKLEMDKIWKEINDHEKIYPDSGSFNEMIMIT